MAVDNGDDFTSILGCGIVLRRQHEHLFRMRGKVAAWPIAFAAFDDYDNTTSLAWILNLRMFQCSIMPSHAK
jgi:hypothetical protein